MSVVVAQVPVRWDVDANLRTVIDVLDEAQGGDAVVFPEGMLSGYDEDLAPLDALDPATVDHAVAQVAAMARQKRVSVFCGSLLASGGGWHNAGLFFDAEGGHSAYRKINLAMNERGRLQPGDDLPTVDVSCGGETVTAAIQLCREIRFPEQWQHLAAQGAQVFFYLTNAANTREPQGVWRSHLISRAAENQRFLVSANIAHPDQHCPSMVVSPRGEVLAELPAGRTDILRQVVDLDATSGWYLGQRRQDVIALNYRPS
ncbi:carbon-nitrogen hydrolase family protein [Actinoplanes solisilvae]|uniref:carbon-nitrogen hydrolase family protein n=1 Tax=Actinoplanes solisilvae TaxID=2486853 RepID=UPI000FD9CCEF|nr:carbon-nitrogen hydrolase family protein [Actinoplanes solisilvae]